MFFSVCGSVTLAAGCLLTVKCSGGGRNPVSQAKYSLSPPVIGEGEGAREEGGGGEEQYNKEERGDRKHRPKKYQESGITNDTSTKDV